MNVIKIIPQYEQLWSKTDSIMKETLFKMGTQNILILTGITMVQVHHSNIEKDMDIMVIILTVMLMVMGMEDMRTSYYSSNTQNMNWDGRPESWVAPGEKHFHKAEGKHPQNTEDIVHNVNVNVMTVAIITKGIAVQMIRKD